MKKIGKIPLDGSIPLYSMSPDPTQRQEMLRQAGALQQAFTLEMLKTYPGGFVEHILSLKRGLRSEDEDTVCFVPVNYLLWLYFIGDKRPGKHKNKVSALFVQTILEKIARLWELPGGIPLSKYPVRRRVVEHVQMIRRSGKSTKESIEFNQLNVMLTMFCLSMHGRVLNPQDEFWLLLQETIPDLAEVFGCRCTPWQFRAMYLPDNPTTNVIVLGAARLATLLSCFTWLFERAAPFYRSYSEETTREQLMIKLFVPVQVSRTANTEDFATSTSIIAGGYLW